MCVIIMITHNAAAQLVAGPAFIPWPCPPKMSIHF